MKALRQFTIYDLRFTSKNIFARIAPWLPIISLSLPRIMRVHLCADVAVGNVRFVDDEELLDGLGLFAHLLKHAAEVVDEILFLLVELRTFLDCVLERADGGIIHAAFGKRLRQQAHRRDALVRVALRLLKFRDGLADLARLKIELAQFEADGEVGGILFNTLLRLGEL